MQRLSLMDQLFHKVGTSGLPPLNMQGALILDPSGLAKPITAMDLAEHIAARLQDFSLLRMKLVQDSLHLGDIKLVEDPNFDVWNHITFRRLPAPGDYRSLTRAVGDFSAQPLNDAIPPWRFEIIDGLEGGKFAILQKISHATMDGVAAMKLFQCLFDPKPMPLAKLKAIKSDAEPLPTDRQLLKIAFKEQAVRSAVHTPKGWLQLYKAAIQLAGDLAFRKQVQSSDQSRPEKRKSSKAPRTSLNTEVSHDRRHVAFANYDFDAMKAVCKRLDCTLNDLVLTMVAEALVHYFAGVGEKLDGSLVIGIPLSVRQAGDGEYGNKVSVALVDVHSKTRSMIKRLHAIQKQTAVHKGSRDESIKTGTPLAFDDVIAMISPAVLDLALMALNKVGAWNLIPPVMNLLVSNIPGPREGVFFAGMRMDYSIPMVPINHTCAVSVGATSMGNHFSIGFHACGRVVEEDDMALLVKGLNAAYVALAAEAGSTALKPASRTRRAAPGKGSAVKAKTATAAKTAAAAAQSKPAEKPLRQAKSTTRSTADKPAKARTSAKVSTPSRARRSK